MNRSNRQSGWNNFLEHNKGSSYKLKIFMSRKKDRPEKSCRN